MIAYWPGTLQYDSCGQLLQYLGVGRMTGHHPYPVTMLIGGALSLGRELFHSDNVGIFIYVFAQFFVQCMVIAYLLLTIKWRWNLSPIVMGELFCYVRLWCIQFTKHLGIYVKAFVEHCNGYFNPMESCYDGVVGWFKILDSDERTD